MDTRYQVVMSQVMLPHQANVAGNVHGGEIMKFMDTAARSRRDEIRQMQLRDCQGG